MPDQFSDPRFAAAYDRHLTESPDERAQREEERERRRETYRDDYEEPERWDGMS